MIQDHEPKRLGIYGGSFDPVHLGHLLLAETCREECDLHQVWFLPCGQSPHKPGGSMASGRERAEMLELAVAGDSRFAVCRNELDRPGPSFTVETLRQLNKEFHDRELFFLMGADSLADLPLWREPLAILELSTIVAVNRGHHTPPDLAMLAARLGPIVYDRIKLISMPAIDISAPEVRQRISSQRSLRFRVPRSVEEYIRQHNLYQPTTIISDDQ